MTQDEYMETIIVMMSLNPNEPDKEGVFVTPAAIAGLHLSVL